LTNVSEFLIEAYVSRTEAPGGPPSAEALSRAADRLTHEGWEVHLMRSILVPAEETCFYLFRARSGDVVREVARRSGLRFERLHEAVSTWSHPQELLDDRTPNTSE
jgi:hypothetical protein